jgi:hypothetical protein
MLPRCAIQFDVCSLLLSGRIQYNASLFQALPFTLLHDFRNPSIIEEGMELPDQHGSTEEQIWHFPLVFLQPK